MKTIHVREANILLFVVIFHSYEYHCVLLSGDQVHRSVQTSPFLSLPFALFPYFLVQPFFSRFSLAYGELCGSIVMFHEAAHDEILMKTHAV